MFETTQKANGKNYLGCSEMFEWFSRLKMDVEQNRTCEHLHCQIIDELVELVGYGQAITRLFNLKITKRLLAKIKRVWPKIINSEKWRLLHDNLSSYSSIIVCQLLPEKEVTEHPPLIWSPSNFRLFSKFKTTFETSFFEYVKAIKKKSMTSILSI